MLRWFTKEWPAHSAAKLDMGKSCIRLKKMDAVPYELIGQLAARMTVQEWVEIYEAAIKRP